MRAGMSSLDVPRVTYVVAFLLFATGIGHVLRSYNLLRSPLSVGIPSVPGYEFAGTCTTLADFSMPNCTFHFGGLVKHGIHAVGMLRRGCDNTSKQRITSQILRVDNIMRFANNTATYHLLPVRGQASWHKSVYNHVCNKVTKKGARRKYDIDCTRGDESFRLRQTDFQESGPSMNPNKLREFVVVARPKNIIFYDYLQLEKLTAPICHSSVEQHSIEINSADAQGYEDYYTKRNIKPWSRSDFWDDMHTYLSSTTGCLHYRVL